MELMAGGAAGKPTVRIIALKQRHSLNKKKLELTNRTESDHLPYKRSPTCKSRGDSRREQKEPPFSLSFQWCNH